MENGVNENGFLVLGDGRWDEGIMFWYLEMDAEVWVVNRICGKHHNECIYGVVVTLQWSGWIKIN